MTRTPMRLDPQFDRLLRNLYLQMRRPRDQFKRCPEDADLLQRIWHQLSGRTDSWQELVRYMQNEQKAATRKKARGQELWPTFDGDHKKAPAFSATIDAEMLVSLRIAYEKVIIPLNLGVDAIAWNEEALNALAREFSLISGQIVPGLVLLAIAEEQRKRGLWPKPGRKRPDKGMDFGDLDDVEAG